MKWARVLIIEDDIEFLNTLEECVLAIFSSRCEIVCACSTDDAYRYLQMSHFDYIISDYHLEGVLNTAYLFNYIKKITKPRSFIAISGDKDLESYFQDKFFDNVLYKPFDISNLVKVLENSQLKA